MQKLIIYVTEKNYNRIIKNTKKYIKKVNIENLKIKYEFSLKEKEKINTIKSIEKAINMKNCEDRYSFIYDTVCDYIDNKYMICNYCDFKNDVCIYFRKNKDLNHKNGCCYSDTRGGLCEHLKNNCCDIKSISCKLYSCEVLRKKKINFKMGQIPLIKYFFNIKQKYFIKYSFFKPKSYVIYKLIENK